MAPDPRPADGPLLDLIRVLVEIVKTSASGSLPPPTPREVHADDAGAHRLSFYARLPHSRL
jgi:hypothetical protein